MKLFESCKQLIEYVHGGHIGGPKQKNDIPFYANIFNCLGPPTWPPCTYSIDHFTVVAKLPGLRMEASLPVTLF